MRLRLALCGAILALLANGGAVGGQEPPPSAAPPPSPAPDEPLARLPAVQVIAPPLDSPFWRPTTPSRVDSLTGRDIERERPSVLPDALQILPGVTLQNEQGNPFQPDLTLRGFVVSPVTGIPQGLSVYLDGVRLNEPTVEEVNFDLLPLEVVDRVEVIRGPSVLFGRNTLGGAISLTTRRGSEARELIPQAEGGSFGRRDLSLRVGGEFKPLDYVVSLRYTAEDGYRDDTDARLARAFAKLGVSRGDTDITVSYQYSNDNIKQAGSLPESELSINRRANFTAGDFFAPELNLATINAEHRFGESLTVNVNAFVRSLRATQFNVNLIAANSTLLNTTLSVGGGVQGTYRTTIAGLRNALIAGLEYTHSYVTSQTLEEEPEGPEPEADLTDTQNAVGAYVQNVLTLFPDFAGRGSNVVLTAAGRYDFLRHDIDDLLGGPSGGRFTFQKFNPRVGVNVNLSERFGAYASYSQGFRAPAFLELTCAGPGAVCPGLQVGVAPDPPLNPVTADNYEIGVYARPLPWLEAELSGYWTNVQDDIFAVSPFGTTGVFFQNIGETRRQGLELSLRARWGRTLDAYLNYAYTLATFQTRAEVATPLPPGTETVQPGDLMPLVPRNRLNLGVNYRPWPWLTLSAEGLFVGSQYFRGDETNTQAPLAPYFVANAGATARWRGLEGFVRINNIFNNQYETFGTFAVNGRAPGNPVEPFVTPAPPINVLVGLQYRF